MSAADTSMPDQSSPTAGVSPDSQPSPQGGSRLAAILSAVAHTASVGIAGSANQKGRSSFVGGVVGGANAELQDQAKQQDIKFKTFDDQMRAANLHNQDLQIQQRQQEQDDAHQKQQDFQHDWEEAHGIKHDVLPNSGDAVLDHLKAQTTGTGSASIPAGTHLSADGDSIHVPKDSPETQAGQLQQYNTFGPVMGLPSLPQGAQFVPPKMLDMLTHKMQGYDINGDNIIADKLPGAIATAQTQRDYLEKNGGTPDQLKQLDHTISIYKANLKADTDAAETAANKASARKIAETKAGIQEKGDQTRETNAAKPQKADTNMYVGTDDAGNQIAGTKEELGSAKGVTKLDADTGKKVVTARQLVSPEGLFAQIRQDMDALDSKGKMGSAGEARFHDALLQKAGSDPDYAPLITHTHLLATALMQAHVGSKGSTDMMEEFKNLANAGKMSAKTLRSALGAEYKYVHEKAMLPKKAGQ